jgi:hypothetical protein
VRYNKCSGGERRKSSLKVGRYPCRVAQPEIINLVGEPLRVAVAPFPVGRAKSLAPGFRRVATAIRRHTPSSKGARQVRSTYARAASPLRNATSAVCRFAAIKKPILLYIRERSNNALWRTTPVHLTRKTKTRISGQARPPYVNGRFHWHLQHPAATPIPF